MSQRPIDRSPDLKRLRDEGYNISVADGYVVVRDVPYVTASRQVLRGVLIVSLNAANDVAQGAPDHTMDWAGEYPCYASGAPIEEIRCCESNARAGNVQATFKFSAKPKPHDRYRDYHAQARAYIARLSGPAGELLPGITAQTYPHLPAAEGESVFTYQDTASSRADISAITKRLEGKTIGILGLGGTGGYILDFLAKTPVAAIHLYDGDVFSQHNAFRAPGAASGQDLEQTPLKVSYFAGVYRRMHRGIVPHPEFFGPQHLHELDDLDFVFLSMEAGDIKQQAVARLIERGIPFVDVGMGIFLRNEALGGTLRVTTVTGSKHDHVKERIPFSDGGIKNEYDRNIQIAELNALNAAFAVIRFKKIFGVYHDQGQEHHMVFAIGRNDINNEEEA
ncbi:MULTISPECIES: ThiF family adenylyltransferase [Methylorubrum]|uniref:ThiF family adenylyltransferase n=1 Tax=Methylorubrum TaxID=2282523 RepID=UPI000DB66FDF|nr:ThiF family adenylyltransferase [Methylorubrum populi]MRI56891.1 ThiF family adenylyltransferase [Methylobacterium sp. DB1607]PZP65691.1 MAG: hypothetical protein DI590_26445 [Methylorubrum populi]